MAEGGVEFAGKNPRTSDLVGDFVSEKTTLDWQAGEATGVDLLNYGDCLVLGGWNAKNVRFFMWCSVGFGVWDGGPSPAVSNG